MLAKGSSNSYRVFFRLFLANIVFESRAVHLAAVGRARGSLRGEMAGPAGSAVTYGATSAEFGEYLQ